MQKSIGLIENPFEETEEEPYNQELVQKSPQEEQKYEAPILEQGKY